MASKARKANSYRAANRNELREAGLLGKRGRHPPHNPPHQPWKWSWKRAVPRREASAA